MANEKHEKTKKTLRVIGILLLCVGVIFAAIGFIDFFSSVSSTSQPTKFWCCFLGFPLIAIGGILTVFGFHREIARYAKDEAVPVFNEAGKELSPAINAIASTAASAIKNTETDKKDTDTASVNQTAVPYVRCPACDTLNEGKNKFCRICGKTLSRRCPNCGEVIPADSKFCPQCGKDFSS